MIPVFYHTIFDRIFVKKIDQIEKKSANWNAKYLWICQTHIENLIKLIDIIHTFVQLEL